MKKVVIIGGYAQGKTTFARQHYPAYMPVTWEAFVQKDSEKPETEHPVFLDDFHLFMRDYFEKPAQEETTYTKQEQRSDYHEIVKKVADYTAWVVVSNEIGSGIVPLERQERMWREETGRMLTKLVAAADEVYRMVAGIPIKIKG